MIKRPIDFVTVPDRPKLHYHRSGRVYVTLTGTELPRRSLRLPPVQGVKGAQIMSVVAQRPWEFRMAEQRRGDISLVARDWPPSVGLTISLIRTRWIDVQSYPQLAPLAPIGLLAQDDSTFFVDLGAAIPSSILVVRSHVHEEPEPDVMEPSVSVAALPWDASRQKAPRGLLALWSAPLAHPLVAQASVAELLTREDLAAPPSGEILLADLKEHTDRIFGSRWSKPSD